MVGRAAERKALGEAAAAARQGYGSAWLLIGEAGLGKSRLLDEAAGAARARGLAVHYGRSWEVGGAPTYWPWIQVLRAVLREHPAEVLPAPHLSKLAPLLPELGATSVPSVEGPEARFGLLEASVEVITAASRAKPLAVLLDDLHAADASSILLLEMLATVARGTGLLLLGTYRPNEADAEIDRHLARAGRVANTLRLAQLDRDAVGAYLGTVLGGLAPPAAVDKLHRTSEGNPLYVVETARWLLAHRDLASISPDETIVVPDTLRGVIEQRLGELSAPTRDALRAASVLGREVTADELRALTGQDPAPPMTEALRLGVLVALDEARHRFVHVLFREALYQELEENRRRALHRTAADLLTRRGAWSAIAHHLLRVGPEARHMARRACVEAAERANATHAYEEAARWYERALSTLLDAPSDAGTRLGLLLDLAGAEIRAGAPDVGRRHCLEAAALARATDDADGLSRAALEYGRVFVFGEVDAVLVQLLEEALARCPAGDSAIRCQLMGRLAAARQPAADPEGPIALAREAIEMARRVDEPRTLLETLRSGCSAMMDLGDPLERAALNAEHVRLAVSLEDPIEAIRGASRLVFDHYELGDPAAARDATETAARFADALALPHYSWRVSALRALECLRTGQLDAHEAHLGNARTLAARTQDPNAERSLAVHEVLRLRLLGRFEDALEALAALAPQLDITWFGPAVKRALAANLLASLGREDEARAELEAALARPQMTLDDLGLIDLLAHTVARVGGFAREASEWEALLAKQPARFGSWGMFGLYIGPPAAQALGALQASRGDLDAARSSFAQAIARLRATGARALVPWALDAEARAVSPHDAARAATLDAQAHAELSALGIGASRPPVADMAAIDRLAHVSTALTLTRQGEHWMLRDGGATHHLRDSKGMQFLARLIEAPGQPHHVLDLASPTGRKEDVDRGDAGPAIDSRARDAYRDRAAALRDEITEAEAHHDPPRALRARAELEALEDELRRALGLGGRARREHSASERARVNVQRRLKDAIRRVAELDAALGERLDRSVRTGTTCVFDPDA